MEGEPRAFFVTVIDRIGWYMIVKISSGEYKGNKIHRCYRKAEAVKCCMTQDYLVRLLSLHSIFMKNWIPRFTIGVKTLFFTTLCIVVVICKQGIGQNSISPPLTREEKIQFDEAKKWAQQGEYQKSNDVYQSMLKKRPDFIDGKLRMAANFYSMGKKEESERLFLDAISQNPDYDSEMYFSLAIVQGDLKKYDVAANHYEKYACLEKNKPDKVKKALERKAIFRFRHNALLHPVPFDPTRLGNTINTPDNEYSPWLSMDGQSLIFTRNAGQEDFYISRRDSNGFQKAFPLFELNTPFDEGTFTLSADGTLMVYTACNRRDLFGSCDLYYSLYFKGRWTPAANMGITVNTSAWESQPSLSGDGRWMVFSSRRLGTKGGADLFYTYRDSTNAWVTPLNIGDSINTTGDEESPFLHPDGHTLYFRSNGRPGMGGHDIFVSRKNEASGEWSQPLNLGYPINTEGSEGGFTVSLDGETAYFATDIQPGSGKKMGQLDIYSFPLYPEVRPHPTTFLKGNVSDARTGMKLPARIRILSLSDQKVVHAILANENGEFLVPVTAGWQYACIAEYQGYSYYSVHFDLKDSTAQYVPFQLDIKLQGLPQGPVLPNQPAPAKSEPIVMENVFFNFNSATLTRESDVEIHQLYLLLASNPRLDVLITGHTDNTGQEKINEALSLARAEAVAEALQIKGIQSQRIRTEGKGSSEPVAANTTAEGRKKNRRTTFVLQSH